MIGGFSVFSYFSTQSKSNRFRKSLGYALQRQPFSTSTQRQIPKSTNYHHHHKQDNTSNKAHQSGPELITENSILNHFPRPNLMPTLHFSLFGYNNNENKDNKKTTQCNNCSGPHSTEFCPC